MVNSPLPQDFALECRKCAKILASFSKNPTGIPGRGMPTDQFIPNDILAKAKGVAILTVIKAGFVWAGRAGSGLVVARLPGGGWSAPSAIGTAGMSFGGQIGAEVTDFVILLNTDSAVRAFSHGGNVTLGGNLSVSAGPYGRTGEIAGTIANFAAIYSYSKSKGLFAGVSIEGSVIIERKDANTKFYKQHVIASQMLRGQIPPPNEACELYQALDRFQPQPLPNDPSQVNQSTPASSSSVSPTDIHSQTNSRTSIGSSDSNKNYNVPTNIRPGPSSSLAYTGPAYQTPTHHTYPREKQSAPIVQHSTTTTTTLSRGPPPPLPVKPPTKPYLASTSTHSSLNRPSVSFAATSSTTTQSTSFTSDNTFKSNSDNTFTPPISPPIIKKPIMAIPTPSTTSMTYHQQMPTPNSSSSTTPYSPSPPPYTSLPSTTTTTTTIQRPPVPSKPKPDMAIALYDFVGQQEGDLSFLKGDLIVVLKKSNSSDEWWTGKHNNKEGVFPANYVQLRS